MKIFSVILIFLLSGCSINITPDTFIYQDKKVETHLDLKHIKSKMTHDHASFDLSELAIETKAGVVLKGIKLSHKDALINIIFFGGSGMKISSSFGILDQFSKLPANVIWFDYRGAGVSEKKGLLKVKDLQTDSLNVFDYSKINLPENIPTVIHGISMGSVLASYVATERNIDALILDSSVSSIPKLVENLTPGWSKLFSTVTVSPELAIVDNTQIIKNYSSPLLVLVAKDDSITPVEFSKELFDASGSSAKTLAVILNSEHGKPMKKEQTIKAYKKFIAKLNCCKNG
ncbi:lysophospholipase [Shewanella sp.]|nr:lysophospholipase [Shewanella sp.]